MEALEEILKLQPTLVIIEDVDLVFNARETNPYGTALGATQLNASASWVVNGVTVPVTGEHVMPAVVRRLEDQDIAVAELTLRGSTLDEVFLSLTGRRPEDEHEEEPAGELEGSAA